MDVDYGPTMDHQPDHGLWTTDSELWANDLPARLLQVTPKIPPIAADRASETEPPMRSMYKRNISASGRWVSTIAGAALATLGYKRSNRALGFLGAGLVARGASGWCPVTAAVERDEPFDEQTKRHLSGPGGLMVEDEITIQRQPDEVYSYWRKLESLPAFMDHLQEVRVIDQLHSHWVAKGPLGVPVEWDAEIINDIPPTLLSWKSTGQSDVVSAGSVRFKAEGEGATRVRVKLQYDPPAGKIGATIASLLGEDPQRQIAADLRRFKELIEAGEVSSVGYRATATSRMMRRELDESETMSDFGDFGSLR
jgi:uncharacterized membrane protein